MKRLRGGLIAHDAWNLGEKLGQHGLTSLLPLAGVWVVCGGCYVRCCRASWRRRGKRKEDAVR